MPKYAVTITHYCTTESESEAEHVEEVLLQQARLTVPGNEDRIEINDVEVVVVAAV